MMVPRWSGARTTWSPAAVSVNDRSIARSLIDLVTCNFWVAFRSDHVNVQPGGCMMSTDKIEKTIVLRAPRSRVWRAIANVEEFNRWFGVDLTGKFVPGARVSGKVTYPGYEHLTMDVLVETVEPERLLTYRWHPNAIDPKMDYSQEPTTL